MIGVAGNPAFWPKGKQYLWSKFPDLQGQFTRHLVWLQTMQLPVGILKDDSICHLKNRAGSGEFSPPQRGQFQVILGTAAMSRSLAGCEADHAGFDSAIGIQLQATAKIPHFVVGMSCNTHQAKHVSL